MGNFRPSKCAYKRKTPEDQISLLPDEILARILSFLALKEAGRTSVLSKRWEHAWTYVSELNFDALNTIREMAARGEGYRRGLEIERSKFVNWVNKVLDSHQTLELISFRIYIDMNDSFREDLDKWLHYALDRRVQRLEVNLTRHGSDGFSDDYALSSEFFVAHASCWSSLKVLILKSVKISGANVEYLLHNCTSLETLVVHGSDDLTSLEVRGPPSLALQHLEILHCSLKSLIVCNAANLALLKIDDPDKAVLKNVSGLVHLGFFGCPYGVKDVFQKRFSCCFSKLKVLSLFLAPRRAQEFEESLPQLPSLKQLSVILGLWYEESMPELTFFFEAAPNLVKFVIKLDYPFKKMTGSTIEQQSENSVVVNRGAVQHLKVVEIHGYRGRIELGLAKYFLKKAVSLEKFIVDPRYQYTIREGEPWYEGINVRGRQEAIADDGRRCAKDQLSGLIPSHVTLQIL
ncbi:OLC1v1008787C1 [Oldenlandia corymbosa var. corymbosa]|uniref:OLC1v1008787C1 n=1 Tax=Oldenlandia corymbosa var. corymbosa TaxID=529605 RepID=A0AAV1DMF9_OLDCO|nr:OLC1v1008787C1 [Oldenlandia corymbosa var. corymbosa]